MASKSTLAGVAHNLAHHAGSGLSFLAPHLSQALRAAGATTTSIDLLADGPYPDGIPESTALRNALASLQAWTVELLAKHGFDRSAVASVVLHASPAPWDASGYFLHTRAVIVAGPNRSYDSGWLQ